MKIIVLIKRGMDFEKVIQPKMIVVSGLLNKVKDDRVSS